MKEKTSARARGTEAAKGKGIMERKLERGAAVVFITSDRIRVNALVEVVNLLYLSPNPSKVDPYGPQKEHAGSVGHWLQQGVPRGYCWLWPDEAAAMSPQDAELKSI